MTTVGELLAEARTAGLARLDAQLLLARSLGRSRVWLIAHDDAVVDDDLAATQRAQCAERARGVPLAYLVGEREFHGLSLRVTPDVLVPRPDTEVLVDWALAMLAGPMAGMLRPAVADLGTGSGAVALAVKQACPRAQVLATDVDPAALAVAQANAARLGLSVEFLASNWFDKLLGRHFDLVLSNPPYIEGDDPHLPALHAEPEHALTPGADGQAALRTIIEHAPAHLRPGGWLLLEHGHQQGAAVERLLADRGFSAVEMRLDLAGHPRCTAGRWTEGENRISLQGL